MDYNLRCTECGATFDSSYDSQLCGKCGSMLEVLYKHRIKPVKGSSFWDYEGLLPKAEYRHFAIGDTGLIRSDYNGLWLKLEIENPTGSFKDRGSVVEIAKASEYGYRNVVCASTGNMAYSIAYYAKLYGIKAKIFISHDANEDKIRKIRSVGNAEIERVDGDFNKALKLAEAYSKRSGAFLTGDYCYRQEGQRTIAYELANQLGGITDVIVPVGNATLISGMLKAYSEFDKAPRVIGVQSSSCKPLFDAFNGKPLRYEAPRTKADAIAVGLPTFGEQALDLIRKSKGMIVTVSDIEMAREQKRFYEEFGRFVELAGAASIAAYRKIKTNRKGRVVAVITGGNV